MKTAGTNPSGFTYASGTALDIIVPEDKKGCFIQRYGMGSGTLSTTGVTLVWDYRYDGVTDAQALSQDSLFKIFGIEMCYIPQGSFYAGDGSVTAVAGHFEDATSGSAKQITSEAQLTLGGGGAGSLGNNNATGMTTPDDFTDATAKTLPATFPKGYNAFYLMKYEVSEGQYTEFLNTLTRLQQNNRVGSNITADAPASSYVYVMSASAAITNRNTITCPASGNGTTNPITFSTTRPNRACNWLSWMDLCAYADWAALRPITDLEFEKACRGPNTPVADEYAWGNTTITAAVDISGTEDGTETITTANANACYNNRTFIGGDATTGSLRCGIFATSISTRITSGSGYYGNMELSGNTHERLVTVGNVTGRNFIGTHGDGILTTTTSYQGNATNVDWPGIDGTLANGVTGATGAGYRGGTWFWSAQYARVSYRIYASLTNALRYNYFGGRCARTSS